MAALAERTADEPAGPSRGGGVTGTLRILVVDDDPAARRGLRAWLEEHEFHVCATACSAEEAVLVARRQPVDVAVADYQLSGRSGLWLSRKLKRLREPPRVVIHSAHADALLAAGAVVAQADALVSKSDTGTELLDAIRSVAGGRPLLPAVSWQLGAIIRCRFEHQEQLIYGLLTAGTPLIEIAQTLDTPAFAIESRLAAMLHKVEQLIAERVVPHQAAGRSLAHGR